MRVLMNVIFPTTDFNAVMRGGTAAQKIGQILEEAKPECVYFTEQHGQRSAVLVVNIDAPSEIPMLAEPWFLSFGAKVEFRMAMTPEDLKKSGLEKLATKWGQ